MSALLTQDVAEAAAALRAGGLVAFPTETVYGLGAAADDEEAVGRIFTVKARPADHPVIVHVATATGLGAYARALPEYGQRLVAACWPGPLTVIAPRLDGVADAAAAGGPTIGVRCPSHPLAQGLLEALGSGIAAPSANRFGRVSPTTAAHVVAELAAVLDPRRDRVLDGGACEVGIESTIVDCTGPRPVLLRSGSITAEQIEDLAGTSLTTARRTVAAPGTLDAHYSPSAEVLVCEPDELAGVVAAAAGPVGLLAPSDVADLPEATRLGAPSDAGEYARLLYAALRAADDAGVRTVVAVPPPDTGVGVAVRDRLRRAAHSSGTGGGA